MRKPDDGIELLLVPIFCLLTYLFLRLL